MQHVPTQQFWHAMQFLPTQQFWPTLWFYMFDGWCFRFNNARTTAFFLTTNATGMYVQVPLGCRRCDLYKTVRGMCFPLIARINSVRFLNHIICFIFIVVTLDRKKGIATLQLTQPLTLHGLVYCWDTPLINVDIDRMGSLNLDCQEALTMPPINGMYSSTGKIFDKGCASISIEFKHLIQFRANSHWKTHRVTSTPDVPASVLAR